MMTAKQAQREARQLFRLCLVNGSLDELRARDVVRPFLAAARPGMLPVLSRFQRLLRLDRTKHSANVTSAVPLPTDVRADLELGLSRLYGRGIVTTFTEDPSLLGGVKVTVGFDVYDGSVKARLAALEGRFSSAFLPQGKGLA
jgi:F-type H+-transporting ATPase subunit delta